MTPLKLRIVVPARTDRRIASLLGAIEHEARLIGADVAAALRGQAPLAVTAEDALRVIYLTELAQQSSDCGRRLAVDTAAV